MSHPLIVFLAYFGLGLALLAAYVALYIRLTPYHELRLVREGNVAASVALVGAVLGFALPVSSAVANSVGLVDMLMWSAVALGVQSLVYLLLARVMPEIVRGIPEGRVAHGVLLGGLSLAAGLLNAASMTY